MNQMQTVFGTRECQRIKSDLCMNIVCLMRFYAIQHVVLYLQLLQHRQPLQQQQQQQRPQNASQVIAREMHNYKIYHTTLHTMYSTYVYVDERTTDTRDNHNDDDAWRTQLIDCKSWYRALLCSALCCFSAPKNRFAHKHKTRQRSQLVLSRPRARCVVLHCVELRSSRLVARGWAAAVSLGLDVANARVNGCRNCARHALVRRFEMEIEEITG